MIHVNRFIRFWAAFVLAGFFILSGLSTPCLAQSSGKDQVKSLYQAYRKLEEQGRYKEAIEYAKELVRVGKKVFGDTHPHIGLFLSNLAGLYHRLGDFAKAERLYKESLAIQEKALGPKHPDVAQTLNNLGLLYYTLGDYSKAEPLYKRSLKIMERVYGAEHPDVASIVGNLAVLYREKKDYARAERWYKRVIAINKKVLGTRHPDLASSLKGLGTVYYALRSYEKAVRAFKESLRILETAYGPEHLEVARSLNDLAVLYRELGDFARAEALYRRSIRIKEKRFGPEDPEVAPSLNNLALLYHTLGDYGKAEPLYKRSLRIMERAYGPEDPEVAVCLSNLATLYFAAGDYDKAEAMLKKSVKIKEKALGPEHPELALSLNNLGGLYKNVGDYGRAEPLYKKSLKIMEKALGKAHPDLAKVLNNLAGFYLTFGNYAKAESLYQRSLEIKKKAYGPSHPSVALSFNNLGQLYKQIGDYRKAARFYERSLQISMKAFGKEHPQVAPALSNLAIIYMTIGDYDKAESLYKRCLATERKVYGPKHPKVALSLNHLAGLDVVRERYASAESAYKEALAIQKDAYGPEHPDVAKSLNNLGLLYMAMGDYARTEALFSKSLALWKKAFGPEHPLVAGLLTNQAVLQAVQGEFEKAHQLFRKLQKIDHDFIDQVIGFTSDEQKIRFLSTKKWSLHCFMSLVQQHLAQDMLSRIDALNAWLRRKGVILEVQKRFQEALIYSEDPEGMKIFQDLARVRTQLQKLIFAGPDKESFDVYKKRIADLRAEEERLEAKLSRVSQGFALKKKIEKADCEKVAGALPPNTALIEFARVAVYNFKAKAKEKRWKPAHYLAFILHSGKGDRVGMIDLGVAEEIDNAVAELREKISDIRDTKGVRTIRSCRKIYDLVFRPLKSELGDVKEIFISPDGNLNLIPFEILQQPDGRYLIEDYTFNYLAAGRDLLGFGQSSGQSKKALLMGDPDFDMGAEEKKTTLRDLDLSQDEERPVSKRSIEMGRFRFGRLPGTREEVEAIFELLGDNQADLYVGKKAVEQVIQETEAPAILHLATHGFFLKDLSLGALANETWHRGIHPVAVIPGPAAKTMKIENPLLRSGIALAGANRTLESGEGGESDGIVTAEKILGLKLQGTDMVVLSACDTGVGEVKTGEGVFGLRRAFTQAGSRSLVMSMWNIPDQETKELMVAFYENILSGEMNRCQSLREAALREMATVKERYGHTNPLYWGGFVFMGEP